MIDCLCFFFIFSLLKTKVSNYPLCLLFVRLRHLGSDIVVARPTHLRSGVAIKPKRLGSGIQKHDWTAKTNIASFKYDFIFIYSKN